MSLVRPEKVRQTLRTPNASARLSMERSKMPVRLQVENLHADQNSRDVPTRANIRARTSASLCRNQHWYVDVYAATNNLSPLSTTIDRHHLDKLASRDLLT